MQERVNQCPAIARIVAGPRTRVNHHPRRLVNNRQIVIFINDIERDFFGNSLEWRTLRLANKSDRLASTQLQRSFRRSVVDKNFFFRDKLLHPRSANTTEVRSEELVEALVCVCWRNRNRTNGMFRHRREHTGKASNERGGSTGRLARR